MTQRICRRWTASERATLEQLRLQGVGRKTIAAMLGRTDIAVKAFLKRNPCPLLLPRREQWVEELTRPHNLAEVARRLGVAIATVTSAKRILKRLGFDVWRCPHVTPNRRRA